MTNSVAEFIRSKKIDTVQKLNLLRLFYQNPKTGATARSLAERLPVTDTRFIEKISRELAAKKVITFSGQPYSLADDPNLKASLPRLLSLYQHPVVRQTLLAQIQAGGRNGLN